MNALEAIDLISGSVPNESGTWADLGAGTGTFTRALAELLAPGSRVYSLDRDTNAVAALRRLAATATRVEVVPMLADFTRPFELPKLGAEKLSGILLANALHFIPAADTVLGALVELLRPNGRVVIVEYDGRGPNRWVPYPIPQARLPTLAATAHLSSFTITATQRSAFGGILYSAVAERRMA
jgi:SAM-dependent methyltransferase